MAQYLGRDIGSGVASPTPSAGLSLAPGEHHVAVCDPGPGLVPLTVRNLKHQAQRAREGACDPSTASPSSGRTMQTTNPSNLSTGHRACKPPQRSRRGAGDRYGHGFTLIEVMIVVAIVAIIAAIALPSYQDSVRKSRRADAVLALQQIQIEQEKLRAECSSFAAGLAAARVCDAATPANNRLALATTSSDAYYTLALTGVTATGYTSTATAVAGTSQANDTGCTVLTLAVAGLTLTRTPAECWTR